MLQKLQSTGPYIVNELEDRDFVFHEFSSLRATVNKSWPIIRAFYGYLDIERR